MEIEAGRVSHIRTKNRAVGAVFLLAGLLQAAPAIPAEPITLAPHRALYGLVLERAHHGSSVTAVRGEMAIEWLRSCDGWTFEHRSAMTVETATGEALRLDTTATSWESLDSRSYRFSMRNTTGDKEPERIEGTATLERVGGPGKAEIAGASAKRFALPAGTLFPVAHSVEVLRRARKGPPPVIFTVPVFDGMGDEGPLDATTTIGRMTRHEADPKAPDARLSGESIWPVHVAYFPAGAASPTPKQEVGMRLFANGVADDLKIGFDDFVVRAKLDRFEYVRGPDCGG